MLRILVLCTGNSARSQMAEAWFRRLGGEEIEVTSAGSQPAAIHPLAVQVMAERGLDLFGHRSKHLEELLGTPFDIVLTVCDHAAAVCPLFPGPAKRVHWGLADPAAVSGPEQLRLEAFRRTRDDLRRRIERFLAEGQG